MLYAMLAAVIFSARFITFFLVADISGFRHDILFTAFVLRAA